MVRVFLKPTDELWYTDSHSLWNTSHKRFLLPLEKNLNIGICWKIIQTNIGRDIFNFYHIDIAEKISTKMILDSI